MVNLMTLEVYPVMKFYVCWLLADEADASVIRAAVVTKDRPLTEWPHLATNDFDAMDVNALERILQPKGKGKRSIGGKLLAKGKMTDEPFVSVSRVDLSFVQKLAGLHDADLTGLAESWVQKLENAKPEVARDLLAKLAAFASQAEEVAKPLLQADVL
jgi:hypothetical protein